MTDFFITSLIYSGIIHFITCIGITVFTAIDISLKSSIKEWICLFFEICLSPWVICLGLFTIIVSFGVVARQNSNNSGVLNRNHCVPLIKHKMTVL